jgi:hypothetical protein
MGQNSLNFPQNAKIAISALVNNIRIKTMVMISYQTKVKVSLIVSVRY